MPEPKAGLTTTSVGQLDSIRLGRWGETLVSQVLPTYGEAVRNGWGFVASNAVGGVAPGTALGTTPPFSIYNPTGSSVEILLCKVSVGYVSGTLGAGCLLLADVTGQTANPTTGTTLTAKNMRIGGAVGAAVVQTGSTVTATPTIRQPVINLTAMLASTANMIAPCEYVFDADCWVLPGTVACFQAIAAAGTSPLVVISCTYIEYPISTLP